MRSLLSFLAWPIHHTLYLHQLCVLDALINAVRSLFIRPKRHAVDLSTCELAQLRGQRELFDPERWVFSFCERQEVLEPPLPVCRCKIRAGSLAVTIASLLSAAASQQRCQFERRNQDTGTGARHMGKKLVCGIWERNGSVRLV